MLPADHVIQFFDKYLAAYRACCPDALVVLPFCDADVTAWETREAVVLPADFRYYITRISKEVPLGSNYSFSLATRANDVKVDLSGEHGDSDSDSTCDTCNDRKVSDCGFDAVLRRYCATECGGVASVEAYYARVERCRAESDPDTEVCCVFPPNAHEAFLPGTVTTGTALTSSKDLLLLQCAGADTTTVETAIFACLHCIDEYTEFACTVASFYDAIRWLGDASWKITPTGLTPRMSDVIRKVQAARALTVLETTILPAVFDGDVHRVVQATTHKHNIRKAVGWGYSDGKSFVWPVLCPSNGHMYRDPVFAAVSLDVPLQIVAVLVEVGGFNDHLHWTSPRYPAECPFAVVVRKGNIAALRILYGSVCKYNMSKRVQVARANGTPAMLAEVVALEKAVASRSLAEAYLKPWVTNAYEYFDKRCPEGGRADPVTSAWRDIVDRIFKQEVLPLLELSFTTDKA